MSYLKGSIKDYIKDLGRFCPAPGGGSAAALTASLGISLLLMAAHYAVNKARDRKALSEINRSRKGLAALQGKAKHLIDRDVTAYMKLHRFIISKKNGKNRKTRMQKALKEAACVPFLIAEAAYEAAQYGGPLLKSGNKNLATNIRSGMSLLHSAFYAARINAEVNLAYTDDKVFVNDTFRLLQAMNKKIQDLSAGVRKEIAADLSKRLKKNERRICG